MQRGTSPAMGLWIFPMNDPYGENELRGAELIDLLNRVTGNPKARIVITGVTFNAWSWALQEVSTTELGPVVDRTSVGSSLNATAIARALERAAKDHIHTVGEISREELRPVHLRQTRHAGIELCDDDEQELRDIVSNAERITSITADYLSSH
jgi:hypothetical protein